MITNDRPLISIQDLKVGLASSSGYVYAVRGINMDIRPGEIIGLVGESGCGKSMTAKTILRLHNEQRTEYGGQILFEGEEDILRMPENRLNRLRGGEISMIFQDPMTTLNPTMRIGRQIEEVLQLHTDMTAQQRYERTLELLRAVGIAPEKERYSQYPFQFSGGQLQRICIAMGLACSPRLLIADEPTTALDVTMQAQILELLKELQRSSGTSILLITHNFGVVAEICERVAVMYAGQIVEFGDAMEIFYHPQHPYTKALINSIPRSGEYGSKLVTIPGAPPLLNHPIVGCPYAARCNKAQEACFTRRPEVQNVSDSHTCMCALMQQTA